MKSYLFYLHVMVLMCALNMQASSSSSSSNVGAAASASAASSSVAAGLQIKTKHDASQAGQSASTSAITPKALNSSSSSSAGAVASVSVAAAIAAGVAQTNDMDVAQAEYEYLSKATQDAKDFYDQTKAKNDLKLQSNPYYQAKQKVALEQKKVVARIYDKILKMESAPKPGEKKITMNVHNDRKKCSFSIQAYPSDNILMIYRYMHERDGVTPRSHSVLLQGDTSQISLIDIKKKMTMQDVTTKTFRISPYAFSPEELTQIYNTQMGT